MRSFLSFSFLFFMQLEVLKLQGSEAPLQPTSPIDYYELLSRMSKKTIDEVSGILTQCHEYHLKEEDLRFYLVSEINLCGNLLKINHSDPLWLNKTVNQINKMLESPTFRENQEQELFRLVNDLNIFLEHQNQHLKKVNDSSFQGAYKFELKDGPAPRPLINMRELRKNIPLISAIVISSSLFLAAKYLISSKRKTTIKK